MKKNVSLGLVALFVLAVVDDSVAVFDDKIFLYSIELLTNDSIDDADDVYFGSCNHHYHQHVTLPLPFVVVLMTILLLTAVEVVTYLVFLAILIVEVYPCCI